MLKEMKETFTVNKIYQSRWVWYHTILAFEIFLTNILLIAILVKMP
tara:strand:- start:8867 stop:9004 length:138 start_codon:yes stop_codon:yes gene_type:complete